MTLITSDEGIEERGSFSAVLRGTSDIQTLPVAGKPFPQLPGLETRFEFIMAQAPENPTVSPISCSADSTPTGNDPYIAINIWNAE